MVIKFTYKHFWPLDANSREPYKEIFVIHPHWEGKVHGIDLKALTPAQLEIFKAVMDPRNNSSQEGLGGQINQYGISGQGIGDDFQRLMARESDPLAEIDNEIATLEKKKQYGERVAAQMGNQFDSAKYERDRNNLMTQRAQVEQDIKDGLYKQQQEVGKKPLPPMAADILARMKPGRMINNPRIFYNAFIKPFLFGNDAYRTFFPARMDAVVEIPRWQWVQGSAQKAAGAMAAMKPKQPTPPQRPKFKGNEQEPTERDLQRQEYAGQMKFAKKPQMAGSGPGGGGRSPGVIESMNSQSGPKVRKNGTEIPKIVKPGRPK